MTFIKTSFDHQIRLPMHWVRWGGVERSKENKINTLCWKEDNELLLMKSGSKITLTQSNFRLNVENSFECTWNTNYGNAKEQELLERNIEKFVQLFSNACIYSILLSCVNAFENCQRTVYWYFALILILNDVECSLP